MNAYDYTSLFPIGFALFAIVLAVRLHFFCVRMQSVYQDKAQERLGLLFFNKLALGSIIIGMLVVLGEFSWTIAGVVSHTPPFEGAMWDGIESVIVLFLAMLCWHAPNTVDLKYRYSDIIRKNKVLEGIITAAGGYVWMKDADGKYIFCDHEFCREFFGLEEDSCDVIGISDLELIDAYRARGLRHDFGDMCVGTDVVTRDEKRRCHFIEMGHIDNCLFILDVVKTPLFDDMGKYVGVVGFAWRNKACEADEVFAQLDAWRKTGRAKKLCRGVYWIEQPEEFCIWDHEVPE